MREVTCPLQRDQEESHVPTASTRSNHLTDEVEMAEGVKNVTAAQRHGSPPTGDARNTSSQSGESAC